MGSIPCWGTKIPSAAWRGQKIGKTPHKTEEWIKKMWYIHAMEYYSGVKRNKILPLAATWMDFEGIMLSEISQRKANAV